MTILPAVESIVRLVLRSSVPGAVLYVQQLTLWAGFLGALLATAGGKHLSLATGSMIPEGGLRRAAQIYTGALSAGVCALLAYAATVLVYKESAQIRTLPGGIPEWWSEVVMPVALGLMAVRFCWRASDRVSGRLIALCAAGGLCLLGFFGSNAGHLLVPGTLAILLGVVLGAPVFVAMAGLAMLLFFADGTTIAAVPTETRRLVASSTLPAIPLLTAAGFVLAEGGASGRLLRLARAFVGWMPGGMALMVVGVCAGFTAFTGGSGVTILALGGLVLPMLVSGGYPEKFGIGLVTTAGSLGLLFPPSLPVILYAVVAGASVADLYIAGFAPCMLLVLVIAAYAIAAGVRHKVPRQEFHFGEAAKSLWLAKWELAIPTIVILSILTGFATMVEAAAWSMVLAVVSQSLLFRDLHWRKELPDVLARGATLVGAVVILLGVAMGLTSYLVDAEIPAAVLAWTKTHIQSQVTFLLVLNAALLVLGSVLEIYSAIIILAPLLTPMAPAYGIDPLHLGIVFLANLELGFLLPPMGLNLILASTRFSQPLTRLYRVALPFLLVLVVGLLLITYVPAMTTGVLRLVR
ncbi:MAG: TRAP transporter large permease subunit [Deltaproteobacteria bacterium]|nr:TRAP transporter large permease subunit [Deltaproteobacteria bacterium]